MVRLSIPGHNELAHGVCNTTRGDEPTPSARATSPRLSSTKPVKFSSRASNSVSNQRNVEVRVTPRSQTFSEPISYTKPVNKTEIMALDENDAMAILTR
jgi:hypothetical protein